MNGIVLVVGDGVTKPPVCVRFWGTRGSIPVALTAADVRAKVRAALEGAIGHGLDTPAKVARHVDEELPFEVTGTFGGHSSCVELDLGGSPHVILDMGSGARPLGQSLQRRHGAAGPHEYHVLLSHLHWDHIMGFPFFLPAYVPGNRIVVHGCHARLEEAFRRQQAEPSFPVELGRLGAEIVFHRMEAGRTYDLDGLRVTPKRQLHPGESFAYRLEWGGRTVVYSTDSEHKLEDQAELDSFVALFRDADLVIFDGMYSLVDAMTSKADWGHSSNVVGLELCQAAGARRLCLFHHDPASSDVAIANMVRATARLGEVSPSPRRVEVLAAYDGLEIEL